MQAPATVVHDDNAAFDDSCTFPALSSALSARTRLTQPAPRSERRSTWIESWVGRKAQRSDQSQGGASKDAEGGWGASIRSAAELSWKASPQTGVKPPTISERLCDELFVTEFSVILEFGFWILAADIIFG